MKTEFKEYTRVRAYYGLKADKRPAIVGTRRLRQLHMSEREKAGASVECSLCGNRTYSESGVCAACESIVGVGLCVYPNSGQTEKGQPHRVAPTKNGVRK